MSSRKEQKEAAREQRLEQERAAASSDRRRRLLGYGVGGVLAVAAIAAVVAVALVNPPGENSSPTSTGEPQEFPEGAVPPPRERNMDAAARTAECQLESPRSEGNDHVTTPVTYRSNPPASGNHAPDWAEDGAYAEPTDPKEKFVHVLEHGRIHVQYRPDAPDEVKGNLKALYDEDPYHMVLSPNLTGMPYEVAATTWTHTLTCPRASERRLRRDPDVQGPLPRPRARVHPVGTATPLARPAGERACKKAPRTARCTTSPASVVAGMSGFRTDAARNIGVRAVFRVVT